jgi:hypothetical protein
MNWESLDWEVLDRLRETFLTDAKTAGPYWHTVTDLECYDLTYGERIGWKWDAVLRELRRLNFTARPGATVLDWGCGSGIAGRRAVGFLGAGNVARLLLHDHSALAVEFATHRARQEFPGLVAERATYRDLEGDTPIDLLVLSHVLNELGDAAKAQLTGLMRRAQTIVWVEPGTHEVSRTLGTWRDELRGEFSVAAPCTHNGACGALAAGNERHWCHFFAAPPPEIFADSTWVKFGQRAGIDLRSLPYCYLVLARAPIVGRASGPTFGENAVGDKPRPTVGASPGISRVIGEPRLHKGYAKIFNCDAHGLRDLTLQKRDAPEFFKTLKRGQAASLQQWVVEGDRITRTGTI